MLNETRAIVRKYNAQLRPAVEAEEGLAWLDFFDGLLLGDEFNSKYSLDGTHMSPTYLPLLADALTEASGGAAATK